MEHPAHTFHRCSDGGGVQDVALYQLDLVKDGGQVLTLARGEVVEHPHTPPTMDQLLHQMRTDETRAPRHQVHNDWLLCQEYLNPCLTFASSCARADKGCYPTQLAPELTLRLSASEPADGSNRQRVAEGWPKEGMKDYPLADR